MTCRPLLPALLALATIACVPTRESDAPQPEFEPTCDELVAEASTPDAIACGAFSIGDGLRSVCRSHCPAPQRCVAPDDGESLGVCGEDPCLSAPCGAERLGVTCSSNCEVWRVVGVEGTDTRLWPGPRMYAALGSHLRPDGSRRTVLFGGGEDGCDSAARLVLSQPGLELAEGVGGLEWRELPGGPTPRCGANFVTIRDGGRERLLLYGGYGLRPDGVEAILTDLWELDEAGWRELLTTGTPPELRLGGLAFDPGPPARLVHFGGRTAGGGTSDETHELLLGPDGGSWRPLGLPDGPAARSTHFLVRHEGTGELLLGFGKDARKEELGDLWRLTPSGWEELDAFGGEQIARRDVAASWDPGHERLLVFGGFGTGWRSMQACKPDVPPEKDFHLDDTLELLDVPGGYTLDNPPLTRLDDGTALDRDLYDEIRCPVGRWAAALAPAPHGPLVPDGDAGVVMFGGSAPMSKLSDLWRLAPRRVFDAAP